MSAVIAMIAAVGRNGAIGAGGDLPWRLPTDFAFYKRTTMGKPLIMGRKTFESIGKPLAGRTNIVVTRSADFAAEGVEVFGDLAAAIARGREIAGRDGVDEVFINGGGEIYRAAMPLAERLYITHVDAAPDGDTYFPQIDPAVWAGTVLSEIVPGEKDSAGFAITVYERR
ncbi:dihydrofolate reductase [Pelagibacterium halotolerans]|uniref:Dihydrofolate reductase n=1 Tax=Pelagibacterium halotolerans (strain DSM 22347 / JCM 15775 / CGMCC 1.7692 / B2) TaxID=1082931 RepID=G4RFC4_PELHB|nr:dihydrofolate reductase [Pelagibacterium halotolerans]AEQ51962.1 dihydrofolate reductase [Pelagibacterium halotolerans B2]QJR18247.1 dihydrofolate reductase [Pelagibacterium halotolerans]SDZ80520.1 dihydrofolate reductase [Pelagibacterium halotolerans]